MSSVQAFGHNADYISFHAAERPDSLALVENDRTISYADISRDLARFTAALPELGLEPGHRVAIGCESVYVHWLLLAACARLGIATASFGKSEGPAAAELLSGMDLVLAEPGFGTAGARRCEAVSAQWLADVLASPAGPPRVPPHAPGDIARIIRTSGTTGVSKRIALTRHMYEAWTERWGWSLGITARSRYLLTMSFVSTGRHTLTNAVLRAGGTVVAGQFESGAALARAVARHSITVMTLLPVQLKQMLDAMPADFAKPPDLTVATIGAAVADSLVERTIARLATEVVSYYGSNEVPFIAEMRLAAAERLMTVFPWVQAEIVDDEGIRLPDGTPGSIRLKSDTMPSGYVDDPTTTRRMFRNGWFYPGDVGVLHGRRLEIMGRGDELLNIGGRKLAPSDVEALVARHVEAADVGVCSLASGEGVEEMYVVLAAPQGNDTELLRRLARAFAGYAYGNIRLVRLSSIPRNANGKILRGKLKEAVASAVGAPRV